MRRRSGRRPTPWSSTTTKRGYRLSGEIGYLNHLLTYVLAGPMAGLNNKVLRECGAEIALLPRPPGFFARRKAWVREKPDYRKHDIQLEHYIVSTGLAEMIRGSAIAAHVDGSGPASSSRTRCSPASSGRRSSSSPPRPRSPRSA